MIADPLYLAVLVAVLVIAAVAGYTFSELRERRRRADSPPEPLPAVYEELANLQWIRDELEQRSHQVPRHEHVWPREPDQRKLGWRRYRCAVPGCPALHWEPQ
jgi:hypothetical protein